MSTTIPFLTLEQGDAAGRALPTGVSDTDLAIPANDGLALVEVTNPTGASINVQLVPTATIGGVAAGSVIVVIAANSKQWLPPLPPALYNTGAGEAHITDESGGSLVFTGVRF